jgi:thioesterase domain-containing protein
VRLSGPNAAADAPPIFFFHPGDGELHHYRYLTPLLDERFRCLGIQAPETVSKRTFSNFDERIAAYVQDIRAVQPHGPYRLIGYSFGGYNAFGVASALEAAGEQVELLSMIDTLTFQVLDQIAPDPGDPALVLAAEFGVRDAELERELASLEMAQKWERVAARARAKGTAASHFDGSEFARLWHILGEVLLPQVRAWPVTTVRARMTLFKAQGTPSPDETLGWRQHMPREQIDVVELPGNHFSPVGPSGVKSLAAKLLETLERAGGR